MKTPTVQLTGTGVAVLVGLLVGGVLIYKASRIASDVAGKTWTGIKTGAQTVGGWVNPLADTNLAYRGVNAIGGALSSDPDWNLGGAIYEATIPYRHGTGPSSEATYDALGNYIGEQAIEPQRGVTGRL